MEFPEKLTIELLPSAELAKLRAELAQVEQRSIERFNSLRKLYMELLELCHELKNYLEV